jgi:linoleoyl-CoA desaturase
MKGAKYSKTVDPEFSRILTQRVNTFFKDKGINPQAEQRMIGKSILLFGLYAGIYVLIISGLISNLPVLFLLWATLGFGQSLIGMAIMHDTVHGAYTKKHLVRMLLEIPIIAIGVETRIWQIEHNIIHHTYPNVDGIDQDIHPRFVFRFTRHQPRKWFHAFQHLYATFVYGLLIIEWLTIKDFVKVVKYHRMKFFKSGVETAAVTIIIILKKLAFYFVFLVLPLMLMPFESLLIVAMFLTMLVVAGINMTIIFQLAHVTSSCNAEAGPVELTDKNWHIHQLETTCNFAHSNKLLSYLIGGLNYQVEHHLFPQVCHVHYPRIAPIVKQTAEEFGVPYHYEKTFRGAVAAHYRHLRSLGQKQT